MRDKRGLIIVAIIALLGFVYWMFQDTAQTLPGEAVNLLGRDHVTDISGVQFNSNPPTSGNHFSIWAKKGVYDRVISDGYLVHSLEHGYVIVSYNCDTNNTPLNSIASSSAQAKDQSATDSGQANQKPLTKMSVPSDGSSWYTPQNPPPAEVALPDSFRSVQCKALVDQLSNLTKAADRVIVVPRPNMDYRVALTAWGRILKLKDLKSQDVLTNDEYKKAEEFAKRFQNKGPEATME